MGINHFNGGFFLFTELVLSLKIMKIIYISQNENKYGQNYC